MNLINRVVVVLLFLVLSITMIVVALLPGLVAGIIMTALVPINGTPIDRPGLTLSAVIVVIVSALIIYVETRPEPSKGVKLGQIKGGVAELSTESIASRIKHAAEAMQDIRQVTPSVLSRGNAVDVKIGLIANPGIDVSQKASEVVDAVRDLVEKDIGVKVGKLRVNIKYDTHAAQQAQKAQKA